MAHENPSHHAGSARIPWGPITLVGLLIVGFVAFPLLSKAFDRSPEGWLRDHYTHVSGSDPDYGILFHADEAPVPVAEEIERGTEASEVHSDGTTVFLRYDAEYLVTVDPDPQGGSRIELLDFDEGYRRHGSSVGHWASYYGTGRGGGSGFGK